MTLQDLLEEKSEYLQNVKNMLMFLKIKGMTEVKTEVVMNELKKKGIDVSFEELSGELMNNGIVADMSQDVITLEQPFSDKNSDKNSENSEEKSEEASRDAVSRMAKSARERREDS